jgi:TolA-binding protein
VDTSSFSEKPVLRLILTIAAAMLSPLAMGQDIVIHQSDSKTTVPREGTIIAWSGLTLRLEQSGRTRDFDGRTVTAIQTQWPDGYQQGLNELQRQDYTSASNSFSNALAAEQRPWAKNIIRSKLLACHLATESLTSAAQTFFEIIATDPQSRFAPMCPLRWTGNDTGMNRSAADWINSDQPIVQLLGASWLIGTDSKTARPVLEALTRDIDPTVAGLAVAQLWNARQKKMTAAQIDVWLKKVPTVPIPVRAGAHFAIAAAQSRSGLIDAAVTHYMRVAILYPDQPLISAPALYQAATLLHNTGRSDDAQRLITELRTKYGASHWSARNLKP